MTKTIAVFGGSFNPPGLHHRCIAEELTRHFDEVVIVPCGPRPDKLTTNDVDPIFRATMADMNFRGLKRVTVELFDLEQATFTRTHALEKRFSERGQVWHVIGTDLIQGGKDGASVIQRTWERGQEIWETLHFVVINRSGYDCDPAELPPKHKVIALNSEGASSIIREKLFNRIPIDDLVTPEIRKYIERYGLYRGRIPNRVTRLNLEDPRLLIVSDERNPQAQAWAAEFRKVEYPQDPNCILVIGGDGMMLHAIQKHWRQRVPFLGINAGHLGFLLNKAEEIFGEHFPPPNLLLRQMPLLYVEAQGPTGEWTTALSFNDAWLERASSQSAWIEVKLNDRVRLSKLVADGVLVSTAAGSTAYARAMGAMPLLAETPALILVGSNVLDPPNWKSVLLSLDSQVEFHALNPEKRPLNGYVSGTLLGEVHLMRIRVSRIAAAELAFLPQHDMAEKIAEIQFPSHTSSAD